MIILQLQIILIAWLVAIATTLPGVFLVVRGLSLMSDAISHSLLLGIVVMFLWVQRLDSHLLLVGAAATGLLTVFITQWLIRIKFLKKDAAIGLVYPLFFSLGIILICRYARNIHIDTDMVLLGEIIFAPFNRLIIAGVDCGPYALWLMAFIAIINALCITLLYKELLITSFDEQYAQVIGYSPVYMYYILMTLTSLTAVCAFDVVGSILVVALMITPPATAYMITHNIKQMILMSIGISMLATLVGYVCAYLLNASIVGCIAVMTGVAFMLVFSLRPHKGILLHMHRRRNNIAYDVQQTCVLLCYYIAQNSMYDEISLVQLGQRLSWSSHIIEQSTIYALTHGYIVRQGSLYRVTEYGMAYLNNHSWLKSRQNN